MIKKFALSISMLLSVAAFAQDGSASPYSFYGIGDQRFKGTNENRAMGGLGVMADSVRLNLQNPASYASLQYTNFAVGASNISNSMEATGVKESANRTTFDYIAVGFPIGRKAGMAFGLMPYTAVGYKVNNIATDGDLSKQYQFTGTGGLNKVFLGGGYSFTKNLSVGADVAYYFGTIDTKVLAAFEGVQNVSRLTNNTIYNGLTFNVSANYKAKIGKYDWQSTVGFAPEANLKTSATRTLGTVVLSTDGSEYSNNDELTLDVASPDYKMPSKYNFGTSFGSVNKWMVGAEVTFQDAKELYAANSLTNLVYDKSSKYVIGGYYTPKYNSFSSYFQRVTYRAGFRFEDTGMNINGQDIKDRAVSAGFGLPLGLSLSSLNLGFEYGSRGTTNIGLVKENYFVVTVGLSFGDKWFKKYEIN